MLILVAAFIHATWNLLNKKASGHATFTWLVAGLSAVFYTPVALAVFFLWHAKIGAGEIGFMAGSALLHTGYFVLINPSYPLGDLFPVFHVSRWTGPLLSSIAAIVFLGDRPSAIALTGAFLIIVGVVVLSANPNKLRQTGAQKAISFALITGTFIAAYTLWDKQAVSQFAISPLLL